MAPRKGKGTGKAKPPRGYRSTARTAPGVVAALRRLGERVRELRLAAGLTQEEAANRARLDGKHWQAIEAGATNPTVATLIGIARALGVGVGRLFGDGA
jgi:DNA-binding XRE family transcriptional regulator